MNLPKFKSRVRVWPRLGHRVQLDHRPVTPDHGGRFVPEHGADVAFDAIHAEMIRSGDLLLFDPRPADVQQAEKEAAEKAAAAELAAKEAAEKAAAEATEVK